jgi:hypothetical protein
MSGSLTTTVTETDLDRAAVGLAETLTRLIEVLEARDGGGNMPPRVPLRPLCEGSHLDFIADVDGNYIGEMTGSKESHFKKYGAQLALCRLCRCKTKCLEKAEPIGIWGGTLPYERRQR